MKDSGIEWIGEIPESWDIISFWQAIERMGTGLNPRENFELTKEDSLYYVTIRNFKDGQLYLDDNCDRISQEAWDVIQTRSDLHKGDIIFASISKDGQAYILDSEPTNWNINESVFCIRINRKYFSEKYFYYHLIDTGFYSDLRMDATGSTFQSIKQNKLRKSRIILPPLPEQRAISAYLDRQCALIDSVTEKTKASIEEYKKLRQAVITQAVTKGVRGDRPMKDSGIEWFGEIPEEWDVVKFKYIASVKSNLVHPTDYQDYWQIAPDNIEKGNAKLLECKTVGEIGVESDNHLFFKGQIIYSKIRPILNKVIIAPFDGLCSADMYPIETTINKYFLVYMMLSDRFLAQVNLVTENRVKMPKINQEELGQILIYNPAIDEQAEIAAYLDRKCAEIDALIAKKETFLTELEAYKKSLIYEYVTGKKEVPQP